MKVSFAATDNQATLLSSCVLAYSSLLANFITLPGRLTRVFEETRGSVDPFLIEQVVRTDPYCNQDLAICIESLRLATDRRKYLVVDVNHLKHFGLAELMTLIELLSNSDGYNGLRWRVTRWLNDCMRVSLTLTPPEKKRPAQMPSLHVRPSAKLASSEIPVANNVFHRALMRTLWNTIHHFMTFEELSELDSLKQTHPGPMPPPVIYLKPETYSRFINHQIQKRVAEMQAKRFDTEIIAKIHLMREINYLLESYSLDHQYVTEKCMKILADEFSKLLVLVPWFSDTSSFQIGVHIFHILSPLTLERNFCAHVCDRANMYWHCPAKWKFNEPDSRTEGVQNNTNSLAKLKFPNLRSTIPSRGQSMIRCVENALTICGILRTPKLGETSLLL